MNPKNWLITGTSSGLGRQLAERLLERGDRVFATLRRAEALADLQRRHPDRLQVGVLDVTDGAAVPRVVDDAFRVFGRVDVVVSNAGFGLFGAAEELSDEQIAHQIDTNLVGSMRVIRAALPHLRGQGGGRVLQLSSEGGQTAYPGFSAYHASKWGIEGFIEAVAQEVAPFRIFFTIAQPGPTRTNFGASLVTAPAMPAYGASAVRQVRDGFADGSFPVRGDADRMAQAMIAAMDAGVAPARLTLGTAAYERIHTALTGRLAALEGQRDLALSCDSEAA
ncbi:SDR family oxidoreductase [Ramlibacter tataouinensis]|uniref:Oxidoreductases-like protein n=1 Tax=Ramlibacter tataouinensis (strain ATCC BAA-407 / DSM 14655 / LMG 21543 / TTB310) TaxID=365046 RepID=F5Y3K0_RAMTT|nr:SDR family oxidoreductase [Ramlibacter tataouinensis]AEG92474.1 oxidoreductases-like protein [Ramlibacter tataouinensis TTB310]